MNKLYFFRKFLRKLTRISNTLLNRIVEPFFLLSFIQKPFPKNPLVQSVIASKKEYLEIFSKSIKKQNSRVSTFEENNGFKINESWFEELCLITQTCIKKSDLNYNHGRILYSLLSKYIADNINNISNLNIIETGTARGFSSLCMSKAINDQRINGKIVTIDCISHNEKLFWNCISDHEGKKTRQELLSNWNMELSNIIFIQGWTVETLNRIGIERVHFAFLDALHEKKSVLQEFKYIQKRQKSGDIVVFDDFTPTLFPGVCEAVEEIAKNYPYKVNILDFEKNRGYAIAQKE